MPRSRILVSVLAITMLGAVSGCGGGADTVRVPVVGYEATDGGRALNLRAELATFQLIDGAKVIEETDTTVAVEVRARGKAEGEGYPALAVYSNTVVTLAEPLGTRKVVTHDGAAVPTIRPLPNG